jgi:hypothetical protein
MTFVCAPTTRVMTRFIQMRNVILTRAHDAARPIANDMPTIKPHRISSLDG